MGKLAVSLVLFGMSAFGASDQDAIQSTFVKPWAEAMRAKDKGRIEQLYHPALRACITPATKEFFEVILDQEVHPSVLGSYRVTKIEPMKQDPPTFLPPEDVSYPARPTYQVQIEFEHSNTIFIRLVAPANGSWYEVYPCPNEKGLAFFRQQQKEGAEQQRKAAQLVAGLKDPLRSELKALLEKQHKIDAIKKYQAASGVDLTTAVLVINALEQPKP